MTLPPVAPNPDPGFLTSRPLYVSGSVLLQGGTIPPEPIAIERVCNGMLRREGYTDSKGQFQFELGRMVEQDASENDSLGGDPRQMKSSGPPGRSKYEGCELHALLAGFRSTSILLHTDGDFEQIRVGTIMLTRMEHVEGATISLASLAAPKEARQAYEKGRKAGAEKKFAEAEKEYAKVVRIYPQHAAAWYMLGEIHRMQNQLDQAGNDYSQSIHYDPQFVSPYFGLALIELDRKDWQNAQRRTSQVIQLNPFAYPIVYFYDSAANFNLRQLEAAEKSARKFQELDTGHRNPEVFRLLAKILETKQDYAGAAQQLRSYLELVKDSPNADAIRADAERLENLSLAQTK